jgi:hypothetical protein
MSRSSPSSSFLIAVVEFTAATINKICDEEVCHGRNGFKRVQTTCLGPRCKYFISFMFLYTKGFILYLDFNEICD